MNREHRQTRESISARTNASAMQHRNSHAQGRRNVCADAFAFVRRFLAYTVATLLAWPMAAWASQPVAYAPAAANDCPCCMQGFGYYPTTWRQWPCETHPEQTNPRSVGAEAIPAPEGRELLPAPQAVRTMPPMVAPQSVPQPPAVLQPAPPQKAESPHPQTAPAVAPPAMPKEPAESPAVPVAPRDKTGMAQPPMQPAIAASTAGPELTQPAFTSNATLSPTAQRVAAAPAMAAQREAAQPADKPVPAEDRPLALRGYCPVELVQRGAWVAGDPQFALAYQGKTYQFSGPVQRRQFLANPEAFAPAAAGCDVVLSHDEHRRVPGDAKHCAIYNGRLYMFASVVTQAKFNVRPERYAAAP